MFEFERTFALPKCAFHLFETHKVQTQIFATPNCHLFFLDFLSWRDDNFHVEPNGCVAFSVFALCLFHYGNWSDMLQFRDVTWPVVQPLMCMNIPLILYRCVWTLLGIVFCIVIHGYNVFAQFPAFQSMCAVAESRWFQQDVIVVAARRQ